MQPQLFDTTLQLEEHLELADMNHQFEIKSLPFPIACFPSSMPFYRHLQLHKRNLLDKLNRLPALNLSAQMR